MLQQSEQHPAQLSVRLPDLENHTVPVKHCWSLLLAASRASHKAGCSRQRTLCGRGTYKAARGGGQPVHSPRVCGRSVHPSYLHCGRRVIQKLHPHEAADVHPARSVACFPQQDGRQHCRLRPVSGARSTPFHLKTVRMTVQIAAVACAVTAHTGCGFQQHIA